VKKDHQIIIADRSRHVREFLKREMDQAGYRVSLAKDGSELLTILKSGSREDLLILDPDFPDIDEGTILANIADCRLLLPVILHTHAALRLPKPLARNAFCYVEKQGNSIDALKQTVSALLAGREVGKQHHA